MWLNQTEKWKDILWHCRAGKMSSCVPGLWRELIFCVGIISISEIDSFWLQVEKLQIKQMSLATFNLHYTA